MFFLNRFKVRSLILFAILLVSAPGIWQTAPPQAVEASATTGPLASVPFVPNKGQFDRAEVLYVALGREYKLFFGRDEIGFASPSQDGQTFRLRLKFQNANPQVRIGGGDLLPGKVNYFLGDDPQSWHTDLPTYSGITYHQLYPGIDLQYNGKQGLLKGTFVVAPGADPSLIQWQYRGVRLLRTTRAGDLQIQPLAPTSGGYLIAPAPLVWQEVNGRRVVVAAHYELSAQTVSLNIGDYNPEYPLIIDPAIPVLAESPSSISPSGAAVNESSSLWGELEGGSQLVPGFAAIDPKITYSTYLGGSDLDDISDIAVDDAGSAYVVGRTLSADFPTNTGAFDETHNSGYDIFVTKFSPAGDSVIFSTYIGGSDGDESSGIAIDDSGGVYITGYTRSSDFPTHNPLEPTLDGISDIFVAKLSAAGNSLEYSTYFGGSSWEYSYGIEVDSSGNAYFAGSTASSDYPLEKAFDWSLNGGSDATLTKIDAQGAHVVYSTYLGGSSGDAAYGGLAVDSSNNVYLAGYTFSGDFPLLNPLDTTPQNLEMFVTKFNPDGNALLFSTFFGGSGEERPWDITVDSWNNIYLTGDTTSGDFPLANALDTTLGGSQDAFVVKLNAAATGIVYSTYLGGSAIDDGKAITVDNAGNAYLTGSTASSDFPLTDMWGTPGGSAYSFITQLNEYGSAMLYSALLGGNGNDEGSAIALDPQGNFYVAGSTDSTTFPTVSAFQPAKAGPTGCDEYDLSCWDAFVTKFTPEVSGPNWVYILYLDGDNNLESYLERARHQLEALASNPNLTLLVLLDGDQAADTWRYHIQPNGNYQDGVTRWNMGELDMGNPQTLVDFINWSRAHYPGKHYYLALADHGRGTTGISWDDSNSHNFITVAELRAALASATTNGTKPLDVVQYDACLMAMLENAYQIKDYADYLIASENLGWSVFAYGRYASQVTATISPEELAMAIAEQYHNSLSQPRTISAMNLGQAGALKDAVHTLATALRANLSTHKFFISNSRDATQKFDSREYEVITNDDEYLDLFNFAQLIKQNVAISSVQNAAQGVMDAADNFVVAEHHASGYSGGNYWDLDEANGVAIYFPPKPNGWGYTDYVGDVSFDFTANSEWDEFLQDFYGVMGLPPETPTDPGIPPMIIQAVDTITVTNTSPTEIGKATILTVTSNGDNVSYGWDLGDGSFDTGSVVTHTYSAVGSYTAVVTASNDISELVGTTDVTITDVPITGLSASNDGPTVMGEATTLTATVASGTNVSYRWDLGDGAAASGSTVVHTYPAVAETYAVVVTASNNAGEAVENTTVTIINRPLEEDQFKVYLPLLLR